MRVAILDTNVLIYLEDIYITDKDKFRRVVNFFQLRFEEIWVPRTVENEFKRTRKRERRYWRMKEKIIVLRRCPIGVSSEEVNALISLGIDDGEADAIIQARKTEYMKRYKNSEIVFITEDRSALRHASDFGILTMDYGEIKQSLREMGVEI